MGGSVGLNAQAHSEQPQPLKRSSSIHMSWRPAFIYSRKIKCWVRVFRAILFFSLVEFPNFVQDHILMHAVHRFLSA